MLQGASAGAKSAVEIWEPLKFANEDTGNKETVGEGKLSEFTREFQALVLLFVGLTVPCIRPPLNTER